MTGYSTRGRLMLPSPNSRLVRAFIMILEAGNIANVGRLILHGCAQGSANVPGQLQAKERCLL
jgi:hypothetical protein